VLLGPACQLVLPPGTVATAHRSVPLPLFGRARDVATPRPGRCCAARAVPRWSGPHPPLYPFAPSRGTAPRDPHLSPASPASASKESTAASHPLFSPLTLLCARPSEPPLIHTPLLGAFPPPFPYLAPLTSLFLPRSSWS
jgi:hypothetical protein